MFIHNTPFKKTRSFKIHLTRKNSICMYHFFVNVPTVQKSIDACPLGSTVSKRTEYPTLFPSGSDLSVATRSATLIALIRRG